MSKSIRRLVLLALFTTMALTIFVIEAQIPLPISIPGIKLGLANVITLIVLAKFRTRDALTVLLLRILLGSFFAGQVTTLIYSLFGGLLCFGGMTILCRILKRKHLWFVSVIGAILHNIGQTIAAILVMGTTQVLVYLPFLTIAGCITGLFTGFVAMEVVKHWPTAVAFSLDSKKESHIIEKK
ncbi:MAG: Gx transporter family protein [Ruminococcus sp.]|nr:Gx transporter family protein [Ruminococcus sp.]